MECNVNSIDSNCTIDEMVEQVKQRPVSLVVVLDKHKPIGMFTERDLVRLLHKKNNKKHIVKDLMSSPVTTVSADLGFRSAYIQLCLNRLRHIIAIDNDGAVVGVAAERNFLGHMGMELFHNVRNMIDLIDKSVPQLPASTPVIDAIELMIQEKRGCVIVIKNDQSFGVFTEHQAPGILALHGDGSLVTLEEVLYDSISVTKDTNVSEVIAQLVSERIGYAVVVDSHNVIFGTISQSSLLESVRAAVYGEMASRQLVDDEILRLETQLEATLEHTPNIAVQWYDKEGYIHYWNHASESLYGWTATEAIGKKLEHLILTGNEATEFIEVLTELMSSGKTIGPKEFLKRDRHDTEHWVESTIFSIPGENSDDSFFVCMDVDITERKQLENQLLKNQTELENLVKKRTQELVLAKERAEAASISKSHFLANMSHEIRTPMNAIIGMTHLALQTKLNDKQKNFISKAHLSSESLLVIINDILDFSKIEAGKLEIESVNFQLKQVINSMLNLIKIKAEENNIQIAIKIDRDVPKRLIGDTLRLNQVLTNLVSNAVKFSHSGDTVSVKIALEEENELEAVLHFSVIDSGIGMSPEQCMKLFKSFNQADSSTTRQYGGTGLGLVIAKKITKMMGGKIWVDSKENVGSTFHFTVCLKKQQDDALLMDSPDINSEVDVSLAIKQLKGSKVLIVEDNEINQELAQELLIMNGITVETAYNGQEALVLLTSQTFDCVLMDCQMPVMDGYEAARKIREMVQHKELPIIAMTANAMVGDKEKVIDAGMNDYITKPLNPNIMFITMAKWVNKKNI